MDRTYFLLIFPWGVMHSSIFCPTFPRAGGILEKVLPGGIWMCNFLEKRLSYEKYVPGDGEFGKNLGPGSENLAKNFGPGEPNPHPFPGHYLCERRCGLILAFQPPWWLRWHLDFSDHPFSSFFQKKVGWQNWSKFSDAFPFGCFRRKFFSDCLITPPPPYIDNYWSLTYIFP